MVKNSVLSRFYFAIYANVTLKFLFIKKINNCTHLFIFKIIIIEILNIIRKWFKILSVSCLPDIFGYFNFPKFEILIKKVNTGILSTNNGYIFFQNENVYKKCLFMTSVERKLRYAKHTQAPRQKQLLLNINCN